MKIRNIILIIVILIFAVFAFAFIKGIFTKICCLPEREFDADNFLKNMDPSEEIQLNNLIYEIEPGKSVEAYLAIQNLYDKANFKIIIISEEEINNWFKYPAEEFNLETDQKRIFPIIITPPPEAKERKTFTVRVLRNGEFYDFQNAFIDIIIN